MAIDHVYAPEQMQECFDLLSPSNYWLLFADVPTGADYGVQLCKAMRLGAVDGYSNATFRPDSPVNLAESSKILAQVFGLSVVESGDTEWYQPYTDALSVSGVNIRKLGHLDEPLTYNQAAELLSQLSKG
jgi:hypothetical protein